MAKSTRRFAQCAVAAAAAAGLVGAGNGGIALAATTVTVAASGGTPNSYLYIDGGVVGSPGTTATQRMGAQAFVANFSVTSVQACVWLANLPPSTTDSATVSIRADTAGVPGAVLASTVFTASSSALLRYCFSFPALALTSGTRYHLVVGGNLEPLSNVAPNDGTGFGYGIVSPINYTGGVFQNSTDGGATWAVFASNNAVFDVSGTIDPAKAPTAVSPFDYAANSYTQPEFGWTGPTLGPGPFHYKVERASDIGFTTGLVGYSSAGSTKTYDFAGITSPSSTHIAHSSAAVASGWVASGATALSPAGQVELASANYTQIATVNAVDTGTLVSQRNLRHFRFKFAVSEAPASITSLRPVWSGYDTFAGGSLQTLYIWNFTTLTWDSRGTSLATVNTTIDGGLITTGSANYVVGGALYLSVTGAAHANPASDLRTEYVKVDVASNVPSPGFSNLAPCTGPPWTLGCGTIYYRVQSPLPAGTYFWRVSASTDGGVSWFPSAPRSLTLDGTLTKLGWRLATSDQFAQGGTTPGILTASDQVALSLVGTSNFALAAAGGTATATSAQAGGPPISAIDGNLSTSWASVDSPSVTLQQLTVGFGQSRTVKTIRFTSATASVTPASFTLSTCVGATCTVRATVTGNVLTTYTLTLPSTVICDGIQIAITLVTGGPTFVVFVDEFQAYGPPPLTGAFTTPPVTLADLRVTSWPDAVYLVTIPDALATMKVTVQRLVSSVWTDTAVSDPVFTGPLTAASRTLVLSSLNAEAQLRFRIDYTAGSTGILSRFSVGGTGVPLSSAPAFSAEWDGSRVRLDWLTTEAADGTVGFDLRRSPDPAGPGTFVTQAPIPVSGDGALTGAAYRWYDPGVVSGATYYYWLDDLRTDGTTRTTGPVSADPPAVTGAANAGHGCTVAGSPRGGGLGVLVLVLGLVLRVVRDRRGSRRQGSQHEVGAGAAAPGAPAPGSPALDGASSKDSAHPRRIPDFPAA